MPSEKGTHAVTFDERLWVPWWWWPLAAAVVAMLGPYVYTGFGPVVVAVTYLVLGSVVTAFLVRWARPVRVADGVLDAGSARVPVGRVTDVRVLSRDGAREVLAGWPEPSAVVLLRGYVKRVVYVATDSDVDLPAYLLLSSRRPAELAAALGMPEAAAEAG